MAIAVLMEIPGLSPEQSAAVAREMGVSGVATGELVHIEGPMEGGIAGRRRLGVTSRLRYLHRHRRDARDAAPGDRASSGPQDDHLAGDDPVQVGLEFQRAFAPRRAERNETYVRTGYHGPMSS